VTDPIDWLKEGRDLGATFDQINAVVVVGSDPVATALLALGIGRVQSQRRRVAIGDLLGESPPLQSLVEAEDPHGLVDTFLYGVSINRVAYQVNEPGELFIMPSGTSPIDYEELFRHPRWKRLAAGFREVGALLILAVPASAPHLRQLVDVSDGAVIVGDEVPGEVPVAQSLAWVRERSSAPMTVAVVDAEEEIAPLPPPPVLVTPRQGRRLAGWAAGVLLTLFLAGAGYWFAQRPFASERKGRTGVAASSPRATAATAGALATDSAARADSLRRDSMARDSAAQLANLAVARDSFPVLLPVNSADSAGASAYAVVLESTTGLAGAIMDLQRQFRVLPATTYSLSLRSRLFDVVSGAYPSRRSADSLLADLRARRILGPGAGTVVALPFAFLVEPNVPAAEVPARLQRRATAQAQPVYALRQPSGAANLYFGAFESPQQAALAVPAVRKAGLAPTLVYRIGRVFQ
jgi:hypothetical protein